MAALKVTDLCEAEVRNRFLCRTDFSNNSLPQTPHVEVTHPMQHKYHVQMILSLNYTDGKISANAINLTWHRFVCWMLVASWGLLRIPLANIHRSSKTRQAVLVLYSRFVLEDHVRYNHHSKSLHFTPSTRQGTYAIYRQSHNEASDLMTDFLTQTSDHSTNSVMGDNVQQQDRAAHYPEPMQPFQNSSEAFEEEGEEYLLVQSSLTSSDHSSIQSTGVLKKMILEGLYDQAYLLLKEINDLGIRVPTSLEYEKPAVAVLKNAKLSLEEKLERFTAWFSLVPSQHLVSAEVRFEEIHRLLIQTHLLHVALLIRFSLICAKKGYVDGFSILVLPHIIRCTSPSVGRTFIEDYCKAYEQYLTDPRNRFQNVRYRIKLTRTNIRGQVIRALAYSGRLDEAIALLPDVKDPTFKLTTYTYNVILQRLHALPIAVRQKNIDLVKQLRGSVDTAIRTPLPDHDDVWETELIRSEVLILETAQPIDFGEDLVSMLRYLKSHIVTTKRSDTAHPFTIVNFISMYLATGRTRAVRMLLEKTLRKSFFATSNFLFAEMLFYRRIQQPHLVIKTFIDHFWLSGLPRDEVLSRYFRFRNRTESYDPSSGEDPPLRRLYNFDNARTLPRGKLWPKRVHCNLVWDALVELATQDRQLELLYGKLLNVAEHTSNSPASNFVVEAEEMPISGLWRSPVGTAAFTPFMTRMMFYRGPSFGVRILRDMLRLGVRPTSYHYTELSGFYARRGDVRKVFLVLDGMERGLRYNLPENSLPRHSGESEPIHEYCLPPPTLVTYISILRGFLIAMNLQGAEEVRERLLNVFKYIPGSSRIADLALQDLEDFKAAGSSWVRRFLLNICATHPKMSSRYILMTDTREPSSNHNYRAPRNCLSRPPYLQ